MLNSLQNDGFSFIFTTLPVHTTLLHTTTPTISTKNPFSTSANFHLPIPPLLFNKITLTISTNTHFLYAAVIFNLPVFAYNHASYLHQKIFSLPHPFSQFRLHRRTKGLRSFNLSRLPQSMDSDIRVHNH